MSLQFIMSREDYDRLCVQPLSTRLTERGFEQVDPYPIRTEQAVIEVRTRGGDTDFRGLSYLVEAGIVAPSKDGKNLAWTREDIDQAIAHLEEHGKLTPAADVRSYLCLNPGQDVEALRDAKKRTGIESEDGMVMVVMPHRPDEYARIEYYSPEEFASMTGGKFPVPAVTKRKPTNR